MGKHHKSKPKSKKSSGFLGKTIEYAAYRTLMDSAGQDSFKRAGVAMGFGKIGVGSYYLTKGFQDVHRQAKGLPPKYDHIDPYAVTGAAIGMGIVNDGDDLLDLAFELDALGAFDPPTDFSDVKINVTPPKQIRKYLWRDYCEDGSQYGVFPQDYETADEYNEALSVAKQSQTDEGSCGDFFHAQDGMNVTAVKKFLWRKYCPDGLQYGVSPEDYETADEYSEALKRAKNTKRNHQ